MSYITHETSKSTKCSTQSSSVAVKIGKIQRKVPGYICNTTTGLVFRMISKFRNNSLRPDLLLCSCCTAIGPTNVRIGPRMRSRKSWRTQTMSKHPSYAAYCMVSSNSGPLTPPSFDGGSPRRPLDDATIRRRRRSRATHTPEHHVDGSTSTKSFSTSTTIIALLVDGSLLGREPMQCTRHCAIGPRSEWPITGRRPGSESYFVD